MKRFRSEGAEGVMFPTGRAAKATPRILIKVSSNNIIVAVSFRPRRCWWVPCKSHAIHVRGTEMLCFKLTYFVLHRRVRIFLNNNSNIIIIIILFSLEIKVNAECSANVGRPLRTLVREAVIVPASTFIHILSVQGPIDIWISNPALEDGEN